MNPALELARTAAALHAQHGDLLAARPTERHDVGPAFDQARSRLAGDRPAGAGEQLSLADEASG